MGKFINYYHQAQSKLQILAMEDRTNDQDKSNVLKHKKYNNLAEHAQRQADARQNTYVIQHTDS